MPSIQTVRNWREYNKSLKKRGAIIFSFDREYLLKLYYSDQQKRGGLRKYNKAMYEYLLTVKVLLRLPWRATESFVEGLLKLAFSKEQIKVPNYAHASREANRLKLSIKQYVPRSIDGMELAFDSTGVNIYTRSGWHQCKHGKNSAYHDMDRWRKIHIAMDLDTMQIQAMAYTPSNINDCETVLQMSKDTSGKIKSIRADAAYDTKEMYKIANDCGAKAIIPPNRRAKMQDELKKKPKVKEAHMLQRDETIKMIRKHNKFDNGLKNWKIHSGYHRRSLIEACMFRFKKAFGFYLQQKTELGRKNEVIAKINILNLMASYGRAQYSA